MANHILLLGGSTPARILTSSLLKAHRHEVSVAGNLAETAAHVRTSQPDVVLATLRDRTPKGLRQDLPDWRIVAHGDQALLVLFLDPGATRDRRLEALAAGARYDRRLRSLTFFCLCVFGAFCAR